ncbi:PA0069 family radical SAM protein [Cyclobacterium plantarum]|uniref:PA0069 family radical SAM protein n=1 Tax=Cyclobacterium plantarum TaxID=2716263 RepID=A0ABX0H6J4_9BACT|nr:PA0069 family radical SAM protein [Cyclobacterium plantarum]NHE57471.1 PA0069 family radical SAM protein [Cyclobacterium plantarum]
MKGADFKGRGTGRQPANIYQKSKLVLDHVEGIDIPEYEENPSTQFFPVSSKTALSFNDSPDLPLNYSVNPYQGCEHGCIYCYARNSHQYWGFDAGLGFESNILVKKDIVSQLKREFEQKGYEPHPIMLSGNTDCYQPAERKFKLTRQILELCLAFRHPVSVITKNSLIDRDIDILKELASHKLVHVYFSINHLDPGLKLLLEPRTATARLKLKLIQKFSAENIPCGIMVAPIIPGINSEDVTKIIEAAGKAGAKKAGYTVVRLNGQIKDLFEGWLETHFPDRKDKVMHQIEQLHGGKANDSAWGRRIKGEGPLSQTIAGLFKLAVHKYIDPNGRMPEYDMSHFKGNGQMKLF